MSSPVVAAPTPAQVSPAKDASSIKSAMRVSAILGDTSPPEELKHTVSSSHSPSPSSSAAFAVSSPVQSSPSAHVVNPAPALSGDSTDKQIQFPVHMTHVDDSFNTSASDNSVPIERQAGEREFVCKFDEYSECNTGQYTLNLARKVISNHFGRNKGCTHTIKSWPLFCRKHYQRATYKPQLWQRRKINLIMRQFEIIEAECPGTTYTIALKKSEEQRLNEFSRHVAAGMNLQEAASMLAPNSDVKSFQAPVDVLRELALHLGPSKSKEDVQSLVATIGDMLEKGETEQVPSIEFLPEILSARSSPAKTSAIVSVEAPPTKSPGTSRISRKGAIRKTSAK